jgi:hypothetical protein
VKEMGVYEEFDELVLQKIEEAKDISLTSLNTDSNPKEKKANPLLTVNELVKTRNEIQAQKAEMEIKQKELDAKKVENINECVKTAGGIAGSIFGTIAFSKMFKNLLKFEETGHIVTSSAGRTILSCLRIFKK